ncbi:hypothetical protein ACU68U_06015 [Finegoldia sp. P3-F-LR]
MFELKKLYKSLIFPVVVIIFCVYSFVTLNSIKYEYTDQDYSYFIKTRNYFENTMMESFVFSKSSENKEEQQKYLDFSKMNFNSLQYIKPLEYDVSMLMEETKAAKYSSKTEHNFYNELLNQYDEIKSFKRQNNLNKLEMDAMFRELDPYFNLIRDEINRYGFYTTSNNFSFFKSFGFLMENVMNDIFLCVVFLIAVFANEMNFKNLKLDTISVSSKKISICKACKVCRILCGCNLIDDCGQYHLFCSKWISNGKRARYDIENCNKPKDRFTYNNECILNGTCFKIHWYGVFDLQHCDDVV